MHLLAAFKRRKLRSLIIEWLVKSQQTAKYYQIQIRKIMSQKSITSYFNSRKRAATEEITSTKNKKAHIDTFSSLPVRRTLVLRHPKYEEPCDDAKNPIIQDLKTNVSLEQKCEKIPEDVVPLSTSKVESVAFAKKVNANNVAKDSKCEAVSLARQELSLGDIKKKLAGSSRLAELRARADRLSRGIQQLKETTDKKNLKQFKSLDVEVPVRWVYKLLYMYIP